MTVNDTTLVHVGEVRRFGATASLRGAPILSGLCGHFQPQLKVTNMSLPSQMLILVFSVCYMLKRKSDAEEALKALIKYYARHGAVIQEIRTDQVGEFGGATKRSVTRVGVAPFTETTRSISFLNVSLKIT